ncbi:MAG TPA: ethylbenzene dehydrogenase-related protein [Anaeromyxobacter sp.]|nr:ethylbenzene dehydrogenase-related protein [Anaeromyxobacter sp.]
MTNTISKLAMALVAMAALALPAAGTAQSRLPVKFVKNAKCNLTDGAWAAVPYQTLSMVKVYETYVAPYDPYGDRNPPSDETRPIDVKAIHNGTDICFSLRWTDATQDLLTNDVPLFADAVAIQVPFNARDMWGNEGLGIEPALPELPPPAPEPVHGEFLGLCPESYHMGAMEPSPEQCGVWIAFWRPDLPGVQNVTGVGQGTVQRTSPSDPASGATVAFAKYELGSWTVILKRPLVGPSPNMVTLERGHHYPIAYSQWDGTLKERNGRKFASDDWNDNIVIE